jgi:hypothetical protein
MELISYKKNVEQGRAKVFSIGGGSIAFENDVIKNPERIYKLDTFSSIAAYCEEKKNILENIAKSYYSDGRITKEVYQAIISYILQK